MNDRPAAGFTLVEAMVVVLLSTLILVPAYRIFQSGMTTSVQGIQQIDMVLEARRIIKQIHADLKASCLELDPARRYTLVDFLTVDRPSTGSLDGTTFSFFAFPLHADKTAAISGNQAAGPAPRLANRITYRLEKTPGPFYRLVREEKVNPLLGGGDQKRVLSDRVNLLSIVPTEIQTTKGSNQWFFQVTLQLAESRQPQGLAALAAAGNLVTNRAAGLVVADFFDVVASEYFQALWNQEFMNRNWHTGVRTP